MLAAAQEARQRLSDRMLTRKAHSPSRDAAPHTSLLGSGNGAPSHSLSHCGQPMQQWQSVSGGSPVSSLPSCSHPSPPGYTEYPRFGAEHAYASYMAQLQAQYQAGACAGYAGFAPQSQLPPRPAVSSYYGALGSGAAGMGGVPPAWAGGAGAAAGSKGDDDDEADEGEEGEEEEGKKVRPMVTCKLILCYIVLLLAGVMYGMVANELHWTHIQKFHPALEGVEYWLHAPHDDPMHGGTHCEAGLFVPGPPRTGANTLLFLALLLWAFIGVAVAADVFMAGIEKITSQEATKTMVLPSGEVRRFSISVWNGTVANLTLMALGSSAPEILLSVIEICGSGFYAGELGPSTIVGSAAFNQMVISAVCVTAIADGSGRLIKETSVFYITAAFSLLAYVWLIVILVLITPNMVDIWEGFVTFAMFPLLVYLAYRADVDSTDDAATEASVDDSPEGTLAAAAVGYGKDGRPISRTDICKAISLKSVAALSPEEQVQAVASLLLPPQSKAYYRAAASRAAFGTAPRDENQSMVDVRKRLLAAPAPPSEKGNAVVQWESQSRICRESEQKCELTLVRSGNLQSTVSVQYATDSGTATSGADFVAAYGTVTFAPFQAEATISIVIIDDDAEEDDETFTVRVHTPSAGCELGAIRVCEVTIQDDDGAGEIHFESREVEVSESSECLKLVVLRTHGSTGTVGCHWATRDGSCHAPAGYTASSGTLTFHEGVTQLTIEVPVSDSGAYARDDDFQVVLSSASGGARCVTDETSRTRHSTTTAIVTVCADKARRERTDQLVGMLDFGSVQPASLAPDSWADQFTEAIELPEDGSSLNLILFWLALPWRLVGACVPPPSYMGGWACFGVALAFIGVLTALIGDLASHMGCCMGLQKSVTAITFVALGTSLPDTFASRSAAASEPYADASIVNITGSNSVNVFLGLGLPWLAAAVYWSVNGAAEEGMWRKRYAEEPWYASDTPVGFAVPAGDLSYSVIVFCAASVVCLSTLILRRKLLGFELGGPAILQWLTFLLFVGLWLGYLYLSISHINGRAAEKHG